MYDPTIGRWLSQDPLGFGVAQPDSDYAGWYKPSGRQLDVEAQVANKQVWYQGPDGWIPLEPQRYHAGDSNLYRYVTNSPMNATDPSGLQSTAYERILDKQMATPEGARAVIDTNTQLFPAMIASVGIGLALPIVVASTPAVVCFVPRLLVRAGPGAVAVGRILLSPNIPRLVAVHGGRVIAHTSNTLLSHAEFVRRFGVPVGSWVGTAIKDPDTGRIFVFNSRGVMGNQSPAPKAIVDIIMSFFQ